MGETVSVDIQVQTTNKTAALNRLHSLGLETGNNDVTDIVTILLSNTVDGLDYFSFRVPDDRVHVIPENNNPTFTIVWRSDRPIEFPEKPLIEVVNYDIDGNPYGTRFEGIGGIQ